MEGKGREGEGREGKERRGETQLKYLYAVLRIFGWSMVPTVRGA